MSQYLVSHGKSGAFGLFAPAQPMRLERGARVVVASARGVEAGTVLCPAGAGHVERLRASAGQLLRLVTAEDDAGLARLGSLSQLLFADSRRLATQHQIDVEIVDVEVLLDGRHAILQYLAGSDVDPTTLALMLEREHGLTVLMENLSLPTAPADEHAGCDKPDCGRESGGCTSCSSDGGCSSCGGGKVDMKAYFAHLRGKMEDRQRTPLL